MKQILVNGGLLVAAAFVWWFVWRVTGEEPVSVLWLLELREALGIAVVLVFLPNLIQGAAGQQQKTEQFACSVAGILTGVAIATVNWGATLGLALVACAMIWCKRQAN